MADAFIGGLAIGLVLLAAALLLTGADWSGAGLATSGSWFMPSGQQPELVTGDIATYQVGKVITPSTTELTLGNFNITSIVTEQAMDGGLVQSGILFGDRALRYSVSDPQFIRFRVTRTNGYGPLLIKVDDKLVQELRPTIGEHTIPLNVRGAAQLEIAAGSSGWMMWAPALYELSDVKVGSARPEIEYSFARGEGFVRGELQLTFTSRKGALTVMLNDRTLWSGSLGGLYSKVVPFTDVKPLNTLAIVADPGSAFIGAAKLVLNYEHIEYVHYETTFNLTSAQLKKLPGYVVFEVLNVQRNGTVAVKLQSGDQTKLLETIEAKAGMAGIGFTKGSIVPGELTRLIVESPDALFSMRNLKVWV